MIKTEFLSVGLTRRETCWGLGYLAFQILFLPSFLSIACLLLPVELDNTRFNLLYMSINLLAAVLIFPRFLLSFFPVSGKKLLRILLVGAAFFVIYWLLNLCLSHLVVLIRPEFVNKNDQAVADMAEISYGLMFLGTVVLAPVTEEIFYRGLLLRGLYGRSPVAAWIVSVSVFGLIHVLGYLSVLSPLELLLSFLQYLPAGVCLAASYRLSGSLICPILIHAAINTVAILALR